MLLCGGEHRRQAKQSAHAVEPHLGRQMEPAEATHPAIELRQDVLEETADQFLRCETDVGRLAGLAGAEKPADSAVG